MINKSKNSIIPPPVWAGFVLGVALTYQFLHLLEHLFIFYQHWWLGISRLGAHGLLFFLDFEWSHFAFNSMYFLTLVVIFWAAGFYRRDTFIKHKIIFFFVIFCTLLQGYHAIEHTVRIFQHIQTSCEPCTGILLSYFDFDDIYLHTFFNTTAFILPTIIFFSAGFLKSFLRSMRLNI